MKISCLGEISKVVGLAGKEKSNAICKSLIATAVKGLDYFVKVTMSDLIGIKRIFYVTTKRKMDILWSLGNLPRKCLDLNDEVI